MGHAWSWSRRRPFGRGCWSDAADVVVGVVLARVAVASVLAGVGLAGLMAAAVD